MNIIAPEPIAAIVTRVWTDNIGLPASWTSEQIRQHLDEMTERIESMIDDALPDQQELVTKYENENGIAPDYLTTVQLITQAGAQIREMVLEQELYSLIPEPEEDSEGAPGSLVEDEKTREDQEREANRTNPDRWKRMLLSNDPTVEIEELTAQLWTGQAPEFQVWAERLMQARHEDEKPIPASTDDPLFQAFTSLVDQVLVDKDLAHAMFRRQ